MPFDLERLEVTGGPVPVLAGLRTFDAWTGAWFDLSPEGTLVYTPGGIGGGASTTAEIATRMGRPLPARDCLDRTEARAPVGGE